MAKKSQQTLDLEKRVRDAEEDASRKFKAMLAYRLARTAAIESFGSPRFSVDLILIHPLTGRELMTPIAVLIDQSGSVDSIDVVDAYEWATRESGKILTEFSSPEDYAYRNLAEDVRRRLVCRPISEKC